MNVDRIEAVMNACFAIGEFVPSRALSMVKQYWSPVLVSCVLMSPEGDGWPVVEDAVVDRDDVVRTIASVVPDRMPVELMNQTPAGWCVLQLACGGQMQAEYTHLFVTESDSWPWKLDETELNRL